MNENMGIIEGIGVSVLGIVIVFAVLAVLMAFIVIMAKALDKKAAKTAVETKTDAPAEIKAPELAKGSCGGVKLYNVPDKTAAMLMAIVADKFETPLNQLRFISIKEVTE